MGENSDGDGDPAPSTGPGSNGSGPSEDGGSGGSPPEDDAEREYEVSSDGEGPEAEREDGFDPGARLEYDEQVGPDREHEESEVGAEAAEPEAAEAEGGSQLQAYEPPDVSLDPDHPDHADRPEPGDLGHAEEETFDPIQDEEMPLADHIEEMVRRLGVVLVIAGAVSLAFFFAPAGDGATLSERSINFLWNSILPAQETTRPVVYGPLSLIMTEFKVASLAGVIAAMPVLVYESYQFMKPGLYPNERRYYLASIPTSLVLAVVGAAFAYRPILPWIFQYFYSYTKNVSDPAFGLSKTFNLILAMMGYFAVIFQIPLFIMLAIMMGVTTRDWLANRRLYFWGGFLGVSFFFVAVDPTGVAPIMIAATMILLFEGTLFLLKWTGR